MLLFSWPGWLPKGFCIMRCILDLDFNWCICDIHLIIWCPPLHPNRRFCKDMNANGLEKKSNFEQLEWVFGRRVCACMCCECVWACKHRVCLWFRAILRQMYGNECVWRDTQDYFITVSSQERCGPPPLLPSGAHWQYEGEITMLYSLFFSLFITLYLHVLLFDYIS